MTRRTCVAERNSGAQRLGHAGAGVGGRAAVDAEHDAPESTLLAALGADRSAAR